MCYDPPMFKALRKKQKTKPGSLVYSATARCPCGLGLAHTNKSDHWDCSGIILGTADPSVKHTDKLPYVFYEIKSEDQPSANGHSTRPK